MYKYKMDLESTLEDTEWTNGQRETSTHTHSFNFVEAGGIIKPGVIKWLNSQENHKHEL